MFFENDFSNGQLIKIEMEIELDSTSMLSSEEFKMEFVKIMKIII